MRCYVLGAGVSKSVGYPLGAGLFDEMDKFVRESGACLDRFDYQRDWPELHRWLNSNPNPTIAQAYRTKNIEHLFTALDFAEELRSDALSLMVNARRDPEVSRERSDVFEAYDKTVEDYRRFRGILLWALEHYFSFRHSADLEESDDQRWDGLRAFADKLSAGDVVITFNYDASVERVLLSRGKWSPKDGFGFELVLLEANGGEKTNSWGKSDVVVLHLHGATGWYHRPFFAPGYTPQGSGAVPIGVFGAAPLETHISLDPQFLQGLGVFSSVDACLPDRLPVAAERHVVLHPSFLKDYSSGEGALTQLWRRAAQALRGAERVFVVGYSLPTADSAALTLLLTNLDRGIGRIVNPDAATKMRLASCFKPATDSAGRPIFKIGQCRDAPVGFPGAPRWPSNRAEGLARPFTRR
jgi:hypothetical protein